MGNYLNPGTDLFEMSLGSEIFNKIKHSFVVLIDEWDCLFREYQQDKEIAALKYNDKNSLSCTITLAFYFAREYYMVIRELPTGKGFADICFLPRKLHQDKPAVIIELKWDKSVQGAIAQIKEKQYVSTLKDYHGNLIMAGINYDKESKEHSCKIEKLEI